MKKIFNFLKSLALFTFTIGLNAQEVKVNELLSKADIHFENGNDSAIHYTSLALELSIKNSDRKGEMNSLFQAAKNEYDRGDLTKSLETAYKSLNIAKEINSYNGITAAQNTIAKIQNRNGDFDNAKTLTQNNIKLAQQQNDSTSIAVFYEFYSSLYRSLGIIDSSLFYINKAIQINKTLKNDRSLGFIYNNLGIFHFTNGNNDSSLYYFHKSLAIRILTKDIKNQIQSKNNIGYINLKMGNNNIAISLLKEAIDLCRKHNSITYLDLSYTNLSEAYEQLGMHEKALTSFKKYTNIKDSINGENVRKQILKIESEIKIASEKEKSIILNKTLQAEKSYKSKQNILIILLIVILIGTIFLSRISKKKTIKFIIEKQKTNAAKDIIDQYEKIDNWIAKELHDDIGGSIAAIRLNMIRTLDIVKSEAEIVNKLKKPTFTMDIAKLNKVVADRENELENLKDVQDNIRDLSHSLVPVSFDGNNFIHLIEKKISSRFSKDINCTIQIHPEDEINNISNDLKFNVYRILQNLAANIITHSKAKNASLQVIGHEDHLTIIVEDDGVGFNPNKSNGGVGLSLIEKRALLFDGKVEIDSKEGSGSTIIIDLPYKVI